MDGKPMSTWQSNYKAMSASQISAEYQRLLIKFPHDKDLGDKLKFLKDEFKIKVRS